MKDFVNCTEDMEPFEVPFDDTENYSTELITDNTTIKDCSVVGDAILPENITITMLLNKIYMIKDFQYKNYKLGQPNDNIMMSLKKEFDVNHICYMFKFKEPLHVVQFKDNPKLYLVRSVECSDESKSNDVPDAILIEIRIKPFQARLELIEYFTNDCYYQLTSEAVTSLLEEEFDMIEEMIK